MFRNDTHHSFLPESVSVGLNTRKPVVGGSQVECLLSRAFPLSSHEEEGPAKEKMQAEV